MDRIRADGRKLRMRLCSHCARLEFQLSNSTVNALNLSQQSGKGLALLAERSTGCWFRADSEGMNQLIARLQVYAADPAKPGGARNACSTAASHLLDALKIGPDDLVNVPRLVQESNDQTL